MGRQAAPVDDAFVSLTAQPSAPALRPLIGALGYVEGRFAHSSELALPNGGAQLLVNLDRDELGSALPGKRAAARHTHGAALQGPSTEPVLIDPAQQRAIVWVAFRTAGAHPLLNAPLSAVRDQLVGLDDLWGVDGAVLRERLLEAMAAGGPQECLRQLEAALLAQAASAPASAPDLAVRSAAARLDRGASVRQTADGLGWTPRRLSARFDAQVGLSPKRYARVRRFQRLLARVNARPVESDWALLAAEGGYHDQAHLIHEFRAFAGMTPTAYAPRSAAERNHVPLDG